MLLGLSVWFSGDQNSEDKGSHRFLATRNPDIAHDMLISGAQKCSLACVFGFLVARNPNIQALMDSWPPEILTFPVMSGFLVARNAP